MVEGKKHSKAVHHLKALLERKGFKVELNKMWAVPDNDRVSAYYPDVTATITMVFEVNGTVGHSSKRSYDNEQNQRKFFEDQDIRFFVYSDSELVGTGWKDSKGNRHKPHKKSELFKDWKI